MLSVAIGWHIYKLTGDPFDLALVGLVQVVPVLSLFIFTGWVVDNFPRKWILIICGLVETCTLISMALVMHADTINTDYIFALMFLHGCTRAFIGPAQSAILPNIVSEDFLAKAVAVTSTVWNTASTSGPFIAGLLIAWIDLDTYWLLGFLSLAGTLLMLTLPPLTHVKPTGRGIEQILGGIRFIKNSPFVLGSISLDLFIVMLGSVMALLPIYAADILHVGPEGLGILRGMPALGAVLVGLAMTRLPPLRHSGPVLFTTLGVFALAILLFAFSTNYWLSLAALAIYGGSDMVSVNIRNTLIQLATPDELRGRVGAVNSIFIASSNDIGDFRAGSVAAVIPPVAAVALGGVMALMVSVAGFYLFPKIRKLDRLTDASNNT
jgi:MFS family permease